MSATVYYLSVKNGSKQKGLLITFYVFFQKIVTKMNCLNMPLKRPLKQQYDITQDSVPSHVSK